MLSSMAGAIATTRTLPKFSLNLHYTQQRPTSGNERNNALSDSLGRNTYKNVTRVANKVAWL